MREIHVSSMRSKEQCNRLFNWSDRNHLNLTPNRPYPPFFFGSLVHYALQELNQHGLLHTTSFPTFLRPYVRSLGPIWLEERQMLASQVKLARQMMEHYMLWVRAQKDVFSDRNLDYLSVEQNFKVHLYDDIYFAGRWDGLARHKPTGKLYLIEYKTARAIDERLDTIRLDDQATGYCWSAQEILGEPIAGVIYTILRKAVPPMPEVLQNGTLSKKRAKMTAEWFMRAIRKHHREDANDALKKVYWSFVQTMLDEGNDYFIRAMVTKTQRELEMFGRKAHGRAPEMMQPIEEWDRSPAWHCRRCLFREACAMMEAGEDYKSYLADNYHYRQDAFLTTDSDVIALDALGLED